MRCSTCDRSRKDDKHARRRAPRIPTTSVPLHRETLSSNRLRRVCDPAVSTQEHRADGGSRAAASQGNVSCVDGTRADPGAGRFVSPGIAWQELDHVVLYETLQRVLTRAVCKWAGVPLASREAARRSKQLALFDAADRSPVHFKSRLARARTKDWAAGLIENVRLGALRPPLRTALREIALQRDIDGQLLSAQAAAVELLDLLRPAVAASGDIVNCARALHQFPKTVERLKAGGQPYRDTFIGELRQRHPALPAVPAQLAVALMRTALDFFTETIRYNTPEPDRHA